ncbi:MAG: shikimate kinase [Clostridia bacterium]
MSAPGVPGGVPDAPGLPGVPGGAARCVMLIGLPGAGKSALGRAVAAQLNRPFIDMDDWICARAGQSVEALFDAGEAVFRTLEKEAVIALLGTGAIVACGGGVVLDAENRRALREGALTIWLDRPLSAIFSDIDPATRPLLRGNPAALYALAQARIPLYAQTATARLRVPAAFPAAKVALTRLILDAPAQGSAQSGSFLP